MMKRIGFIFLVVCMFPLYSYASDISFGWFPPTTNVDGTVLTDLGGYNLYYGTQSRGESSTLNPQAYAFSIQVGNFVDYTLTGISPGFWCFAVTAYDTSGNESNFSNEVCTTVGDGPVSIDITPPNTPENLRYVAQIQNVPVEIVSISPINYTFTVLEENETIYIDRNFRIVQYPDLSAWLIRTANNDKKNTSLNFMTIELSSPSTIYIAYDVRLSPPTWLIMNYIETSFTVVTTDTTFVLWKKGNMQDIIVPGNGGVSSSSMYFVLVEK
jgi:hypothetical protein